MKRIQMLMGVALLGAGGAAASADVFETYESFNESFLGTTFYSNGVTYRDTNTVGGVFPDGAEFTPADLGQQFIIERAVPLYDAFPGYGSPNNALTFGSAFIVGDNLSIGALAEAWMDLDVAGSAASFDLAYYENGPWGGIEFRLEALADGVVVDTDSFVIADGGGRDNPAYRTMSVSAASFDSLHLYAWFDGNYSAPRGIMDNLSITAVPEPGALGLLALSGLAALRRR